MLTSWDSKSRPRQFRLIAENSLCSIFLQANVIVLDASALAGAGREVADGDPQAGLHGELGEFGLPQPEP
jgi:hypothetical protein